MGSVYKALADVLQKVVGRGPGSTKYHVEIDEIVADVPTHTLSIANPRNQKDRYAQIAVLPDGEGHEYRMFLGTDTQPSLIIKGNGAVPEQMRDVFAAVVQAYAGSRKIQNLRADRGLSEEEIPDTEAKFVERIRQNLQGESVSPLQLH